MPGGSTPGFRLPRGPHAESLAEAREVARGKAARNDPEGALKTE